MKYKHIKTEILASSVKLDIPNAKSTFQANISFDILPQIEGHVIPEQYKTPCLTFFDLEFNTLDIQQVLSEADAKGLAKLKEVYGDTNVE